MAAPLPMTAPLDARSQARKVLATRSAFAKCDEAVLEALLEQAPIVSFDRDEKVCRQGESGDHMLVIIAGALKVTRVLSDGTEIELGYVKRGETVGEIVAISGGERTANVTALETTKAVAIASTRIREIIGEDPTALSGVLDAVCDRLRRTMARLEPSAPRSNAQPEKTSEPQDGRRAVI